MRIERDKWKHFYVGIAMGIVAQALLSWLLPTYILVDSLIAFVIVLVISYGFELYSKFTGRGHYEILDAVAATVGGVLGMGLILLLYLFNK